MLRRALLAVVVLVVGAGAPAYGQEVNLRWKFKEGDIFFVEELSTSKSSVNVLGMQAKEESKNTVVTSYTVQKVHRGGIVLVQKIEAAECKTQGGLAGGATEKVFEKLKGATFVMHLTPQGKVTKLEGFKEFAKKLAGDDDDLSKLVNLIFNESFFKAMAEQTFGMAPEGPVKKGDSWKVDGVFPLATIGDCKMASEYTYTGRGDTGEKIGIKQTLNYVAPKGADLGGIAKIVQGKLKSDNGKGHCIFDPERGRLVSAQTTMVIKGVLTVDIGGMNVDLNMTIDQNTNVRVLDKNPNKE